MTRFALVLALLALFACSHSSKAPDKAAPTTFPDVPNLNAKRWENGRELAGKALGVAPGQLAHQSLGNGRFVFQAGGKEAEYALYCLGWSCVWLDDPRARAAFDLDCPREQLAITFLNETTRGVAGCGRRATYLAQVEQNYQVTWLMNSPVQQ